MFVALCQAAGTVVFLNAFRHELSPPVIKRIGRLALLAAWVALALTASYFFLSPARFAGSFDGALDPSLVSLWLHSSAGTANIVRFVGLALLTVSLRNTGEPSRLIGTIGVALALVSFLLMGHTSVHGLRWLLAPLLFIHLAVIVGWFGALLPLCWITRDEPAGTSGPVIARFSALATRVVPLIFVCGAIIAWVFLGSLGALVTAYGAMIVAKTLGFAVLMALAALNKWRYAPAIATGSARAARNFRRTTWSEIVIIAAIIMTTAVMTSLFAPEHLHTTATHHAEPH